MDSATSESGEPASPGDSGQSGAGDSADGTGALPVENAIFSVYNNGIFLISSYGWYILLCGIILIIVWANIKPSVERWLKKREEKQEEMNFDPVKAERYQDGMVKAREKMQRELEEKAAEHEALMEERKAQERDEKIKQWEEFKVVSKPKSLKQPKSENDTKKYNPPSRREYLPLGGGGGGAGFRPSRRTFGGGG